MKLFLVRHGETIHNVTHVYAGITDSPLTVHGGLQAERLGKAFADYGIRFTHIFSSDLQRARKTANAVCSVQPQANGRAKKIDVVPLAVLREQDFGSLEEIPFFAAARDSKASEKEHYRSQHYPDPNFKEVESKESMDSRAKNFLQQRLVPILLHDSDGKTTVAIVSHGIILSHLWKCFVALFSKNSVTLGPGLSVGNGGGAPLEYLGGWANTGYLELDIERKEMFDQPVLDPSMTPSNSTNNSLPLSPSLSEFKMVIRAVNAQDHLSGLKRTRGGVGSSKLDDDQKKIESFFKKKG